MRTVSPIGLMADIRTTNNSNIALDEKTLSLTSTGNDKKSSPNTNLANIETSIIEGYPNQVHNQKLSAFWNKDPYWGIRHTK